MSSLSCSTGIEGTKTIKMTRAEKRENRPTPEDLLMADLVPQHLADWNIGKTFTIVDEKARLVLSPEMPMPDSVSGIKLRYAGVESRPTPDGKEETLILFFDVRNAIRYATGRAPGIATESISAVDIPMIVDDDLVESAAKLLVGKNLWTRTALWYDNEGNPIEGRKYVPVSVSAVRPGNAFFPFIIDFYDENGNAASLFMNIKNEAGIGAESRTFPALFSLADPKISYPTISPEVWELITKGEVRIGMTKEECKLSLGNPSEVDAGHNWNNLVDIWKYKDGTFLYFEDGRLSNFRH
ncbi:MAG: hypothetical protein K2G67_04750 [Muribaculaceae bacterium]|nr:hypothetical protein [Muribaculaceae bacterium]